MNDKSGEMRDYFDELFIPRLFPGRPEKKTEKYIYLVMIYDSR
jgi:hypothetical protein